MITPSTITFLKTLQKNNNREWFDKNKEKYLFAKENIEEFTNDIIKAISKFDKKIAELTHKDCVFRIYRDVRFAKDKSPYKTNMGAYISPGGKKSNNAGYYIHIEPGNKSMLAGGMYTPMAPELKKIRQEIDYNTKTIKKILSDKDFKKYFGELSDMRLKRTPKGYAEDHPEINLLKQTSFIVVKKYSDKEVLAKNFVSEIAKGAKIMKPLCDFLNEAIK